MVKIFFVFFIEFQKTSKICTSRPEYPLITHRCVMNLVFPITSALRIWLEGTREEFECCKERELIRGNRVDCENEKAK